MKEIVYDKLVRDKIPEIIEKSGKQCEIEILSDEKYLEMIDKKFDEELAEYHKDKNIEELADLLEVIYAATKVLGYSIEDLENVRVEKAEKRGGEPHPQRLPEHHRQRARRHDGQAPFRRRLLRRYPLSHPHLCR